MVMRHDKPLCAKLNIYGFTDYARLSEVKHFWVKLRNKSHRIFYVLYINISLRTKQSSCGSMSKLWTLFTNYRILKNKLNPFD